MVKLLYQGHASLRLTLFDGRVVYIDPYKGQRHTYALPADLILITHDHHDHNRADLCAKKQDCRVITQKEALAGGEHNSFDIGGLLIRAVRAENKNHDSNECVGYILEADGVKIYVAGDTSQTAQMADFAALNLDYAFFPGDGYYNMGLDEAAECARIVGAKHNILIHLQPSDSHREKFAEWQAPNKLLIEPGGETELI